MQKKVDWAGRKEQSWIGKGGEESGLERRKQEEGWGGEGGEREGEGELCLVLDVETIMLRPSSMCD